MIRLAEPEDLPEIIEIYNEAVFHKGPTGDLPPVTADLTPVTAGDRRSWFEEHKAGTALLEYAIGESRVMGKKTLFALILDSNSTSIKLLEKFGFKQWGCMPAVADIDGVEYGHLIYGLRIG